MTYIRSDSYPQMTKMKIRSFNNKDIRRIYSRQNGNPSRLDKDRNNKDRDKTDGDKKWS